MIVAQILHNLLPFWFGFVHTIAWFLRLSSNTNSCRGCISPSITTAPHLFSTSPTATCPTAASTASATITASTATTSYSPISTTVVFCKYNSLGEHLELVFRLNRSCRTVLCKRQWHNGIRRWEVATTATWRCLIRPTQDANSNASRTVAESMIIEMWVDNMMILSSHRRPLSSSLTYWTSSKMTGT